MPTPQKYRKKTGIVEAYQTKVLREVKTVSGKRIARPGNWIIKHSNGDLAVATDEYFKKYYEKVM